MVVHVQVNVAKFTVKVTMHCCVAIVVRPSASTTRSFCDKGCTGIFRRFSSVCEMKSRDAPQSNRKADLAADTGTGN